MDFNTNKLSRNPEEKSQKYQIDLLNSISRGIAGLKIETSNSKKLVTWTNNLMGMVYDIFKDKQEDLYVVWLRPDTENEKTLTHYKNKGLPKNQRHYQFNLGEGVAGKVWDTGQSVGATKIDNHEWWVFRDGCENLSYIRVPVGQPRSALGVLAVGSDKGFEVSEKDISTLKIFGAILGLKKT